MNLDMLQSILEIYLVGVFVNLIFIGLIGGYTEQQKVKFLPSFWSVIIWIIITSYILGLLLKFLVILIRGR